MSRDAGGLAEAPRRARAPGGLAEAPRRGRLVAWLRRRARSAVTGGGGVQTHAVAGRGNALTRVLEPAAAAGEGVSERAELRIKRLECIPVSDE